MVQPMLLPLRSSQAQSNWAPLETRVRQIESQKGSFRTVTEKGLQEDIEKAKTSNTNVVFEDEESESEDEGPEAKQKKLWEAREEMLRQLSRAQNETLTALDAISLLISGHEKAGVGARASMSPALSSVVPINSLDVQKVRKAKISASAKQQSESLYIGYRLDSLKKAIDKINVARSRLSEQTEQESAFWKQVADLSALGLIISRLPRDSRIIGVHFGFPEATPRFRNRGFAVLRTDQDGRLRLDQAVAASRRYTVQISILKAGKVTSRSTVSQLDSSDISVAATVASLRRSLFEEELFFEIGREARTIVNQGVTISSQSITAELCDGQMMRIELVEYGQQSAENESVTSDIADGIVLCLRGLLVKGHEQTLARRSIPPAPLAPKTLPLPEYALLRPLLSHVRHRNLISTLQSWCGSVKRTMDTAGVNFDAKFSTTMPFEPQSGDASRAALFLDILLAPAGTIVKIALPTSQTFEVEIRTHLAPPAFGTVFTASPIEYASDTIIPPKMPDFESAKSGICHVMTADLVRLIVNAQDPRVSSKKRWTSSGYFGGAAKSQRASLYIHADISTSLSLRYHETHSAASPMRDATWVWHAAEMSNAFAGTRDGQELRHLMEIINQLSK